MPFGIDLKQSIFANGASVDGVTTAETAMKAGKLNFKVAKTPAYARPGGKLKRVDERFFCYRTDTGAVFKEAVSDAYEILQPADAFKAFDDAIGEGLANYEVVGSNDGGARIWVLASVPRTRTSIVKGDEVMLYMLLQNSYDKSSAVRTGAVPYRFTCDNAIRGAVSASRAQGMSVVTFRHTRSLQHRLTTGINIISEAINGWDQEVKEDKALAKRKFKDDTALSEAVIDIVTKRRQDRFADYEVPETVADLKPKQRDIAEKVIELHETGRGSDIRGVQGTAWGVFNAFSEYVDHHAGKDGDAAFDYALHGSGADMKEAAREILLAGVS